MNLAPLGSASSRQWLAHATVSHGLRGLVVGWALRGTPLRRYACLHNVRCVLKPFTAFGDGQLAVKPLDRL